MVVVMLFFNSAEGTGEHMGIDEVLIVVAIETFTSILWVNLISSCQEALEIRYAGMSRRYLIHSREAGKRCLMSLPLLFCGIAPGTFCYNEAMTRYTVDPTLDQSYFARTNDLFVSILSSI